MPKCTHCLDGPRSRYPVAIIEELRKIRHSPHITNHSNAPGRPMAHRPLLVMKRGGQEGKRLGPARISQTHRRRDSHVLLGVLEQRPQNRNHLCCGAAAELPD